MLDIKRKTKLILGGFILLFTALYIIFLTGFRDTSPYIFPLFGIVLGIIILIESSVAVYFNKSTYKTLTLPEVLGMVSSVIGGAVILLSISQLGLLPVAWNTAISSLFASIGIVIAIIVGIVAFAHMLT